nr:MAG TPA: hypothetical protein [Caudoviricetes sp.]
MLPYKSKKFMTYLNYISIYIRIKKRGEYVKVE